MSAKGNFPKENFISTTKIVFIQSKKLLTLKSLKVHSLDRSIIQIQSSKLLHTATLNIFIKPIKEIINMSTQLNMVQIIPLAQGQERINHNSNGRGKRLK